MHFDDRLATVLRQTAASEAIARIQYRQLLDLLGSGSDQAGSSTADAAYLRLAQLGRTLPAATRTAILGERVVRLRNPRLLALLGRDEPPVASAAFASAELDEEQWQDLVPALPVSARGILRHKRDLPAAVDALLDRLGVHDRALPDSAVRVAANDVVRESPVIDVGVDPVVDPVAGPVIEPVLDPGIEPVIEPVIDMASARRAAPDGSEHGIRAIVRRIEEFRKGRHDEAMHGWGASGDPRLPLGDGGHGEASEINGFDFATDAENRIVWADPRVAPMVVGLGLAANDAAAPAVPSPALRLALRRFQPVRGETIEITGAPAISGRWTVDAAPRFDLPGGRHMGHIGRMRRPVTGEAGRPVTDRAVAEADRMRQMLHELRTPVNGIQGCAEATQQALFGPIGHEYRAIAAAIAGDAARIIAAFDELDRLVKLRTGALDLGTGGADLAAAVTATVAQLAAYGDPRGSGFDLSGAGDAIPVAIDRTEADRLVWRLLASLASATMPNERLPLVLQRDDAQGAMTVTMPETLARLDEGALFQASMDGAQPALSSGMFGPGFSLRLARAEAQAAGGGLERDGPRLRLILPRPIAGPALGSTPATCDARHDMQRR